MFEWDDLRYFLAVVRTDSGSRAATRLKVNQSTVSRRIAILEKGLGTPLFDRTPRGFALNREGQNLVPMAEAVEELVLRIEHSFAGRDRQPRGLVRVATVEEIAALFIAPGLPDFRKKWPGIKVELLTGIETLDLHKREADVALRLARPTHGDLQARRVGGFGYGVYASASYLASLAADPFDVALDELDWIKHEDYDGFSSESAWFKTYLPNVEPVLKCNSFKTQMAAVLAGLGAALLPRPMARIHSQLRRLSADTQGVGKDIWLVCHRELRESVAMQAVMDFLVESLRKAPDPVS